MPTEVQEQETQQEEQQTPPPEEQHELFAEAAGETPPAEPEVEVPAEPALHERLGELGFKDVDESSAQNRLFEAYQTQQRELQEIREAQERNKQLADYGQQYLELQQDESVRNFLAQRNEKPTTITKQETEPWWNPPEVQQNWLERYGEVDPTTGETRLKDNTPANVRGAIEQYTAYIADWQDGLVRRPAETLRPAIQAEARAIFEELYQERRQREQSDDFIERLREENKDWLYETDPLTQRPVTSRLSPEGQEVMRYVDEAEQMGIDDPRAQWQYANRMYRLDVLEKGANATDKSVTAAEKREQKRRTHLRRAVSESNRSGSVSTETQERKPQNTNIRRGEQLLADLEADGVPLP